MIRLLYENFNPKIHNTRKVAELVYDVDFRTFDLLFKNQDKAITTIENDLKKHEQTPTFKVLLHEDREVIGILRAYISRMPHDFRIRSLKLVVVDILDYFVLCDIKKGDLYIAEIAIDHSLRGKGLGQKVLNDVVCYARDKNLNRVILDADFRNDGAKKLYEKLGFEVFNKKRIKLGNFERGMYNMELIL